MAMAWPGLHVDLWWPRGAEKKEHVTGAPSLTAGQLREGLPKVQLKYLCGTGWACRSALGPLCNVNVCVFPAPLSTAYQF